MFCGSRQAVIVFLLLTWMKKTLTITAHFMFLLLGLKANVITRGDFRDLRDVEICLQSRIITKLIVQAMRIVLLFLEINI